MAWVSLSTGIEDATQHFYSEMADVCQPWFNRDRKYTLKTLTVC